MGFEPPGPDGSHDERMARYAAVSTALGLLSDRRLGELVGGASLVASGIGGAAVRLHVDGTPVFVKVVPLTDLERRPENVMSTANVFHLPPHCQYGLGSAGGGVWREVAAHTMATSWVLGKRSESFPLLYHWRLLPDLPPRANATEELADVSAMVEFWDGSAAVRERLDAIGRSSASVALFCEYFPENLHEWLTRQVTAGGEATNSACVMVERNLRSAVSFMNANGMLHLDTHFRNILTDGRGLYISDFGLATSPRFELSAAESRFYQANRSHDGCYAVTELVNWLVTALTGAVGRADRVDGVRRCADGDVPAGIATSAAAIIERYAPIAVVMNGFYDKLYFESRATPYPAEEIATVCHAAGFEPVLAASDI